MASKGELFFLEDDQGNKGKMYRRDGLTWSAFGHTVEECDQIYEDIQRFNTRPDDIWICAFAKSGTHWLWEVVSMLITNAKELIPVPKEDAMLENRRAETLENIPSRRVLNSHHFIQNLPSGMWTAGNKVIHSMRSIKDILVSYYHHKVKGGSYSGTFEAFVKLYDQAFTTLWYRYEHEWYTKHNDNPNVLFLKYEDMVKDPYQMIKKIVDFLEISTTEEQMRLVMDKTSLKNMRENKVEKLMKGVLYRKGQPGDWKNHFTVAMNEHFNKTHEERMKDANIYFEFDMH